MPLGEVWQAQGRLGQAQVEFGGDLWRSVGACRPAARQRRWQWEVAVAQGRVGDVLQTQGQLAAALAAFREYLAISRRLAEQDPDNDGWQRELAVAHSRVGGVLEAQGQLAGCPRGVRGGPGDQPASGRAGPSNAGWQRGLAAAHRRFGGVLEAQGQLAAGLGRRLREGLDDPPAPGRARTRPTQAGRTSAWHRSERRLGGTLAAAHSRWPESWRPRANWRRPRRRSAELSRDQPAPGRAGPGQRRLAAGPGGGLHSTRPYRSQDW